MKCDQTSKRLFMNSPATKPKEINAGEKDKHKITIR